MSMRTPTIWSVVASLLVFTPSTTAFDETIEEAAAEEITVTARRRSENIQDIPLAITAVGSEALDALGVQSLNDLSAFAPNLTIVNGSGQTNGASIYIRGIGQRDSLQTFEQGVGLYVDGVYYSRMQASLARLFDVERIEVLRGPQGSLYGKNTVGGAVNIITRSPFSKEGGQIEITYGSYDQKIAAGYISAPLSDAVSVSIAAQYSKRDGFFQDPSTGEEYNDDNVFVGRFKLGFKPSDTFELTLSADLMEIDIALAAGRQEDDLFNLDVVLGPQQIYSKPGEFDGNVGVSIAPGNGQSNSHYGFSAIADWQANDTLSVKSITSYRHMDPVQWVDVDGTSYAIADVIATWVHQQFSEELQIHIQQETWDMVLGAFFMTEESVAVQETFLDDYLLAGGASLGFSRPGNDEQDVTNYALFGHANVRLSEKFEASFGARWSKDVKHFVRFSETAFNRMVTEVFAFDDKDSWAAFTPSLALQYNMSDNSMFFARVARGFRSGGFNGRLFSDADKEPFEPEFVWSYEAGFKGSSEDNTIRYGANAFYNDYTNFQARIAVFVDSDDPGAGFNFPTVNAGKLEIYGAEFDITADLDMLSLWANVGLLNSSYKEFIDDRGDKTDEEPIRSPGLTLSGGIVYTWSLGDSGKLRIAADARYISSYYTSVDNSENLFEDGYTMLNATLKWEPNESGLYAKAGVRNLLDATYHIDAFEFRTLGNAQVAFYGDPRTWYLSVGMRF